MDNSQVPSDMLPLQDRDLLHRLTDYFDSVDRRVQLGEGWLIFNASGARSSRITNYVLERARELRPTYNYLYMPWRDFALSAYMVAVELKAMEQERRWLTETARRNLEIANKISTQTMARSITSDLLILSDLRPHHRHEVEYLMDTIERRYRDCLPTIILTPDQPNQLAIDIANAAPLGEESWQTLAARLYEKNLVAI